MACFRAKCSDISFISIESNSITCYTRNGSSRRCLTIQKFQYLYKNSLFIIKLAFLGIYFTIFDIFNLSVSFS